MHGCELVIVSRHGIDPIFKILPVDVGVIIGIITLLELSSISMPQDMLADYLHWFGRVLERSVVQRVVAPSVVDLSDINWLILIRSSGACLSNYSLLRELIELNQVLK